MNIRFIDGSIFEGMDDAGRNPHLPPGSAKWSRESQDGPITNLIFICPCGCQMVRSVPVAGKQKWNWDGNEQAPTLTPSIQIIGECGWHGWLTAGNFKTC